MHLRVRTGLATLGAALVLTTTAGAAPLGVGSFEAGLYGAVAVPVAQEDVATGPLYGAKVRLGILPILKAELSGTLFDFADGEVDVEGGTLDIPAPEVRSYNLNGILAFSSAGAIGHVLHGRRRAHRANGRDHR